MCNDREITGVFNCLHKATVFCDGTNVEYIGVRGHRPLQIGSDRFAQIRQIHRINKADIGAAFHITFRISNIRITIISLRT